MSKCQPAVILALMCKRVGNHSSRLVSYPPVLDGDTPGGRSMASSEDDREPSSVLAEPPAETKGARLAAIAALFGPFTVGCTEKRGGSDTASRPGHEHGRPGAD